MQCKSLWIKASAKCINVNVVFIVYRKFYITLKVSGRETKLRGRKKDHPLGRVGKYKNILCCLFVYLFVYTHKHSLKGVIWCNLNFSFVFGVLQAVCAYIRSVKLQRLKYQIQRYYLSKLILVHALLKRLIQTRPTCVRHCEERSA